MMWDSSSTVPPSMLPVPSFEPPVPGCLLLIFLLSLRAFIMSAASCSAGSYASDCVSDLDVVWMHMLRMSYTSSSIPWCAGLCLLVVVVMDEDGCIEAMIRTPVMKAFIISSSSSSSLIMLYLGESLTLTATSLSMDLHLILTVLKSMEENFSIKSAVVSFMNLKERIINFVLDIYQQQKDTWDLIERQNIGELRHLLIREQSMEELNVNVEVLDQALSRGNSSFHVLRVWSSRVTCNFPEFDPVWSYCMGSGSGYRHNSACSSMNFSFAAASSSASDSSATSVDLREGFPFQSVTVLSNEGSIHLIL
ncbi:hypothetical protein Tco_1301042 [Tanacetum coccineum]